jgi:hypothetical protein
MTRQIDIAISVPASKQRRLSAVLSADEEHYTITNTDAVVAGKFSRSTTSHKVHPFKFKVAITNEKGSAYLHSLTKESLLFLVIFTLLGIAAIISTFTLQWPWWLMLPPLMLNALIGAYLAQKTYYIVRFIQ